MVVIFFSGRAAGDSPMFEGGTPITLDIIDSDSTRAAMATDCSPGPSHNHAVAVVYINKTVKPGGTNTRTHAQATCAVLLPDHRPPSFPAFVTEEGVSG